MEATRRAAGAQCWLGIFFPLNLGWCLALYCIPWVRRCLGGSPEEGEHDSGLVLWHPTGVCPRSSPIGASPPSPCSTHRASTIWHLSMSLLQFVCWQIWMSEILAGAVQAQAPPEGCSSHPNFGCLTRTAQIVLWRCFLWVSCKGLSRWDKSHLRWVGLVGIVSCSAGSWGIFVLENPKVKSTTELGPGLISPVSCLGFCSICSSLGAPILPSVKPFGQMGDTEKNDVLEVGWKRRQLEWASRLWDWVEAGQVSAQPCPVYWEPQHQLLQFPNCSGGWIWSPFFQNGFLDCFAVAFLLTVLQKAWRW